MENKNIHAQHRKRMKEKYKLHGIDIFQNHEILEFALFYAVPRKNTNEIAHKLLDKFGSLAGVLESPVLALQEVDGIGQEAALFIKLLLDIARVYLEEKRSSKNICNSKDELISRLCAKFVGRENEVSAMILVDAKNKILYNGIVSKGCHNSVDVYLRRIVELIVLYNAAGVVFAHNHPSGIALPSKNDIVTAKKLKNTFNTMNVEFIDNLIVVENDFVSFADCHMPGIFD